MNGYFGQIMLFAGEFAPRGWEYCNGKVMSTNNDMNLFSILGTRYGGDGRTTFNLPTMPSKDGVSYIICVDGQYPSRS